MAQLSWPKGTRNESFGFLLQVLARRVDVEMKTRLDELGLEFRFFPTLMFLLAGDGQSQRELGEYLGLAEYQVSRNLDAMGEKGLVERRPDPNSRRTTLVFLTDNGRELAAKLPPVIKELNDDFLAPLSKSERIQLLETMQKLHSATG